MNGDMLSVDNSRTHLNWDNINYEMSLISLNGDNEQPVGDVKMLKLMESLKEEYNKKLKSTFNIGNGDGMNKYVNNYSTFYLMYILL